MKFITRKQLRFGILLLTLFMLGCKAKDAPGIAIITVYYGNGTQTASEAEIYVKKGFITDPGISLNQYDQNVTTTPNGQYIFDGLDEGDYFFYVKATKDTLTLKGSGYISVTRKPAPNRYEKKIYVQ